MKKPTSEQLLWRARYHERKKKKGFMKRQRDYSFKRWREKRLKTGQPIRKYKKKITKRWTSWREFVSPATGLIYFTRARTVFKNGKFVKVDIQYKHKSDLFLNPLNQNELSSINN